MNPLKSVSRIDGKLSCYFLKYDIVIPLYVTITVGTHQYPSGISDHMAQCSTVCTHLRTVTAQISTRARRTAHASEPLL